VSRVVDALEHAEASDAEDEAQLAFDALLYRLVVIGEAVEGQQLTLAAGWSDRRARKLAVRG
jgi:hypothetical protein